MAHGLSVNDLLNTKYLKYITKVVAGESGLSKSVSWVHILEIRDIVNECVNGDELVLTTGIGFTSKDVALRFLQELICQGVAALCIETALYYHKIEKELIDLANENDFPLIEISEISRFVDISKGLNTMLINDGSQLYQDADNYLSHLSEISSKGTIADGIRYTAEYLNVDIAYLPIKGKSYGSSPELKNFINTRLAALEKSLADDEIYMSGNIAIKHLKILEKNWGYLIFNSTRRAISQFDTIILNRLSNTLKDSILSEMLDREHEHYKNNDWLKQWLHGNLSETSIKENLRYSGMPYNNGPMFVCSTSLCCSKFTNAAYYPEIPSKYSEDQHKSFDEFILHTTVIVKRVFGDEGFSVLGYMEEDMISYIVLIPSGMDDVWDSVERSIGQLRQYKNQFNDYRDSIFCIGRIVNKHTDLIKSYETAVDMMNSADVRCGRTMIYDKLYLDRILQPLKGSRLLDEFIADQLGRLLEPEFAELLYTLKVFYECNCSKQKTAERLFIVRQTLYFRLEKIEDILGKDYDEGERRFALEYAIHAYYYKMKADDRLHD